MSIDVEKIIANANRMSTIQRQQEQAYVEFEQQMVVAENGGIFTLTPNLLTYMYWRIQQTNPTFDKSITTTLVLFDDYKMPIQLTNSESTFEKWTKIHVEGLNALHSKVAKIKKTKTSRSTKKTAD